MKPWLMPLLAVLLCTGLTAWCCHLEGMSRRDVKTAVLVTFAVSACTASLAATIAAVIPRRPTTKP